MQGEALQRINQMSHTQLCKASQRRSYTGSQLHGKQASQVQERSEDLEQSREDTVEYMQQPCKFL